MATNVFARVVGETVQMVTEQTETVLLSDFLAANAQLHKIEPPFFPGGNTCYIRNWRRQGNKQLFLLEEPPRMRTIRWKWWPDYPNCQQRPVDNTLEVSVPYAVWAIRTVNDAVEAGGSLQLFFSPKPVTADMDVLYAPPLANVRVPSTDYHGRSCRLCFGDAHLQVDISTPLADKVAAIPELFWSSAFNMDLSDNMVRQASSSPIWQRGPFSWQEESQKNPLFVLTPTAFIFACRVKEVLAWLP